MGARAHAVTVKPAARADRANMRAGMNAAVADTGARAHDMPDMAAGRHAMLAHARARAEPPTWAPAPTPCLSTCAPTPTPST